jgi:hypothetical protein
MLEMEEKLENEATVDRMSECTSTPVQWQNK